MGFVSLLVGIDLKDTDLRRTAFFRDSVQYQPPCSDLTEASISSASNAL